MAGPGPSFTAGGTITPMCFVKSSTTQDNQVLLCGSGDKPIGISQPEQRWAPWAPIQDGNAAKQGENIRVWTEGEVCWLILGAGGCTAGDYLKPDANGNGVTSSSDGDIYGAQALEKGTVGQQVRVQVLNGMRGA